MEWTFRIESMITINDISNKHSTVPSQYGFNPKLHNCLQNETPQLLAKHVLNSTITCSRQVTFHAHQFSATTQEVCISKIYFAFESCQNTYNLSSKNQSSEGPETYIVITIQGRLRFLLRCIIQVICLRNISSLRNVPLGCNTFHPQSISQVFLNQRNMKIYTMSFSK